MINNSLFLHADYNLIFDLRLYFIVQYYLLLVLNQVVRDNINNSFVFHTLRINNHVQYNVFLRIFNL